MLRSYVEQPLIDRMQIEQRLDAVAELKKNMICREETAGISESGSTTLERLISRVVYQTANPRDLIRAEDFPEDASADPRHDGGFFQ